MQLDAAGRRRRGAVDLQLGVDHYGQQRPVDVDLGRWPASRTCAHVPHTCKCRPLTRARNALSVAHSRAAAWGRRATSAGGDTRDGVFWRQLTVVAQADVSTLVSITVQNAFVIDGVSIVALSKPAQLLGAARFTDASLLTSNTTLAFTWTSVGDVVRVVARGEAVHDSSANGHTWPPRSGGTSFGGRATAHAADSDQLVGGAVRTVRVQPRHCAFGDGCQQPLFLQARGQLDPPVRHGLWRDRLPHQHGALSALGARAGGTHAPSMC